MCEPSPARREPAEGRAGGVSGRAHNVHREDTPHTAPAAHRAQDTPILGEAFRGSAQPRPHRPLRPRPPLPGSGCREHRASRTPVPGRCWCSWICKELTCLQILSVPPLWGLPNFLILS
nr:zinc finger protein 596 isoform X6 [Bos taurus]